MTLSPAAFSNSFPLGWCETVWWANDQIGGRALQVVPVGARAARQNALDRSCRAEPLHLVLPGAWQRAAAARRPDMLVCPPGKDEASTDLIGLKENSNEASVSAG